MATDAAKPDERIVIIEDSNDSQMDDFKLRHSFSGSSESSDSESGEEK